MIDARPREQRVVVENLNIVKRHTRPRPMRDASRMGGTQMTPGGVIEKAGAGAGLERDARLPDVQPPDADRDDDQGGQGRARCTCASASAPTAARRSTSERRGNGYKPRLKTLYERGAPRRA